MQIEHDYVTQRRNITMALVRDMHGHEAERVRDLWLQMCVEAGTPLPASAADPILTNLKQYAAHQAARCFVAEEQSTLIGFVTCCVMGHPITPGLVGEIEELYVQPGSHAQTVLVELVRQAVVFMKKGGVRSVHTRIGIGEESPKEGEERIFWQSLGWENDMTIYSIYSDVPGDPRLQQVWDGYQVHAQTETGDQNS
jgi:acetyltransferase (GNAT) family protein